MKKIPTPLSLILLNVTAAGLLAQTTRPRAPAAVAPGAGAPASASASPATRPSAFQFQSFAMTHPGDPARGKVFFFDTSHLGCSRCHSVEAPDAGRSGEAGKAGGQDKWVGPPLFAVGDKLGRRDLIESVLEPSASIAVGYSTTTVRTRSDVYQGIVRESAGGAVTLMQADGTLARIAAGDVARQQTTDTSLMPEGLQNGLTPQEFADLVEYLASLKLPESAAAVGHGMPATIPELETPVALRPIGRGRFEHPVWFGAVPGAADTCAVEEHDSGKIWFLKSGGGADSKVLFADTGHSQRGARGSVGLAFHPRFADNGRYYFLKQLVTAGHFRAVLFEGRADDARRADSGRLAKLVLRVDMSSANHFGGGLQFGPDGYLYVGIGDTGPQGDPHGNAQNPALLAGKILRIDVDHPDPRDPAKPYSIPPDNPFVANRDFRPEIWAWGLRQAWRFSFDSLTGDLWEGDVGQDLYEEVNLVRRGGNYGWNVFEGFEPYSNQRRRDHETYLPPVFAYTRRYGASVTGGFVYRADPASSFYGVYVFGDYETGRLFGLTQEHGALKQVRQIGKSPEHVVSFGTDARGEIYVVGYEGTISRLDFAHAVFK